MEFIERLHFSARRRLPLFLQTEAAECGLASLGMIAWFHGHRIDLAGLRRRFAVSLKGATLAYLMQVAGRLHMAPRPLRLELEELARLRMPCILHWDLNHFVVLKSVEARGVVIHDPAYGIRRLALSEVSKHFTGIALEVLPTTRFREADERRRLHLRDLTGTLLGLKRSLSQVLVLALALQAISIVSPFYMQWVVDGAVVAGDRDLLTVLGIGFLLLAVTQVALTALRSSEPATSAMGFSVASVKLRGFAASGQKFLAQLDQAGRSCRSVTAPVARAIDQRAAPLRNGLQQLAEERGVHRSPLTMCTAYSRCFGCRKVCALSG